MLLITVDRSSSTPIFKQICNRIGTLVEEGSLKPGEKLPTSRRLATVIGTHRSTVVRAYDECRAQGYLESTPGSYTRVRKRGNTTRQTGTTDVINWDQVVTGTQKSMRKLVDKTVHADELIDFDTLAADPSLTPDDVLRRAIKQTLVRNKYAALDYTDPAGWYPLRKSVAERLQVHGTTVSPEEVLITNGAQQALDLILRLLVKPGDFIAVESPTYSMMHPLLRLHGIYPVEIPMTSQGMDLDELERRLQTDQLKLVYTMPNFHNPMGITTDQAHRERLISLCESAGVPIVEDGFEEEMKYFGKAVLPLKSMDTGGIVFYVGSFSKVVFSGLRIGWIAASQKAIKYLAVIQQTSCLSVNTLIQAALTDFCTDGKFDTHLRKIHTIYRRRMQKMLKGLNEYLPHSATWTKPSGGYTLWLTLPDSAGEESRLYDEFKSAGVALAPGQRFFGKSQTLPHFRISIACVDEGVIEEGCRRLGGVLS